LEFNLKPLQIGCESVTVLFVCFQLHDVKVRRMAELLEKTHSSYFPAFKNIFKGVVAGKELCTFQAKSVFVVTDFID